MSEGDPSPTRAGPPVISPKFGKCFLCRRPVPSQNVSGLASRFALKVFANQLARCCGDGPQEVFDRSKFLGLLLCTECYQQVTEYIDLSQQAEMLQAKAGRYLNHLLGAMASDGGRGSGAEAAKPKGLPQSLLVVNGQGMGDEETLRKMLVDKCKRVIITQPPEPRTKEKDSRESQSAKQVNGFEVKVKVEGQTSAEVFTSIKNEGRDDATAIDQSNHRTDKPRSCCSFSFNRRPRPSDDTVDGRIFKFDVIDSTGQSSARSRSQSRSPIRIRSSEPNQRKNYQNVCH